METLSELRELARSQKIVRTNLIEWALEERADHKDLQSEPLLDYIHKIRFFNANINRAKGREFAHDIDLDEVDCYRIGIKQKWLCAITGDKLEFTRGGQMFNGKWCNPMSCTNDRIDPNEGYFPDNVQLVTWEANWFKNGLTMGQFKDLIQKTYACLNL